MNLAQRVTTLERDYKALEAELKDIRQFVPISQFISVSKAASVLDISTKTLYERIKHAKAFPRESPYKEGIHWKQHEIASKVPGKDPTIRYRVNPVAWRKAQ
jgi:predicted DNA-binding transcriptional regulator AlpA